MPQDLKAVLKRDNLEVRDSTFDGGLSPEESMSAFAGVYDPKMFESQPVVYAVEIADSDESRLPTGLHARMVHVGNVEQDLGGPTPPPGEKPNAVVIETDMFTFFAADSGAHLATVYIGPES